MPALHSGVGFWNIANAEVLYKSDMRRLGVRHRNNAIRGDKISRFTGLRSLDKIVRKPIVIGRMLRFQMNLATLQDRVCCIAPVMEGNEGTQPDDPGETQNVTRAIRPTTVLPRCLRRNHVSASTPTPSSLERDTGAFGLRLDAIHRWWHMVSPQAEQKQSHRYSRETTLLRSRCPLKIKA